MIPKKIHYCWFGKKEKPQLTKRCIASWKKHCPDYEIIEWNEENFNIDLNPYTRMCYQQKKYAFYQIMCVFWLLKSTVEFILIQM